MLILSQKVLQYPYIKESRGRGHSVLFSPAIPQSGVSIGARKKRRDYVLIHLSTGIAKHLVRNEYKTVTYAMYVANILA